jgi:hypothetical protein
MLVVTLVLFNYLLGASKSLYQEIYFLVLFSCDFEFEPCLILITT